MSPGQVPNAIRRQRFEQWVSEYSDSVLRTCYVYLADRTLAEDAMQDTFLKVWKSMDSFEGRNNCTARTWIIRIAMNTCKNYKNSAWHRRVDQSKLVEELPHAMSSVTDESRLVFFEVLQLPEKLKQVVILYYYHDMNMAEIGEVLKISRSAVQHRLQRAYALLRAQLGGSESNEAR